MIDGQETSPRTETADFPVIPAHGEESVNHEYGAHQAGDTLQQLAINGVNMARSGNGYLKGRHFNDNNWRAQATCRGMPPEYFFPIDKRGVEDAQEVCGICAVRLACLEYALETKQDAGVWGGISERERVKMRQERRQPPQA